MYLRACLSERWRVCSMIDRSEAPPRAADFGASERTGKADRKHGPVANRAQILRGSRDRPGSVQQWAATKVEHIPVVRGR